MPSFHPAYAFVGAALLAYVGIDLVWTTMHRGGGPTTRLLLAPLWRLAVHTRHRGLTSHRAMSVAGLLLVAITVALWIALLWAAWTLVFLAEPGAVRNAESEVPASVAERVYYVGFNIFTLGIGDYNPHGFRWQVLTTISSLSGFAVVTFAITYLMPVVQAAVEKRAFATRLSALGRSPAAMLVACQDGPETRFGEVLEDAIGGLAQLAQTHEAYPVLHFFHATEDAESAALAVARLDEAVTLAQHATRTPLCRAGLCRQWNTILERFLRTVGISDDDDVETPRPPGRLALIGELPLVGEQDFAARLEPLAAHRRRLHAMVRRHGWPWEAVDPGEAR